MSTMDMLLGTNDSLSFSEMLEFDIKSEMDALMGANSDYAGFNVSDVQPLELEDIHEVKWLNSNSNHSILDYSDDMTVNPNTVMPLLSIASNMRSPSPALKESHLTFSPATIKITSLKPADTVNVKKDLLNRLESVIEVKKPVTATTQTVKPATAQQKQTNTAAMHKNTQTTFKSLTKIAPILAKPNTFTTANNNSSSFLIKNVSKGTNTPATILHFRNAVNNAYSATTKQHVIASAVRALTPAVSRNKINPSSTVRATIKPEDDARVFPKPAYSYSCLIAMALKNSRSGSLPVSEIYNFMCKHFPYFKTAPNGWKNSVRHNLSLNKCFEKIEKLAVNGAQRKGCLWAMNPEKIGKMDDEVQKWSKKDPGAIRRAMLNPDDLEALERGEMKFSCSFDEGEQFGDSCGSAAESEDGSDSEPEQEVDVDVLNPNLHFEYVHIKADDPEDGDVDVTEDLSYEDMEEDKELLRMEMALAQKELFEYERTINNKRRKTYIIQH